MEDKIELKQTKEEHNYLTKLRKPKAEESYSYLLHTKSAFTKTGMTGNNARYIRPAGGPMIIEGEFLQEANAKVESISYTSLGWVITFDPESLVENEINEE